MKEAYLICSFKNINFLINSQNLNLKKSNKLIITDKLAIYIFLKKEGFKNIQCLDHKFKGSIKKNLFIKNYRYFDQKLMSIGIKNNIKIDNVRINSIYNTFCFDLPRLYAGVKFILSSLDQVIKIHRIKRINYLDDLEHDFLSKTFYRKVFQFHLKKKKVFFSTFSNTENNFNFLFMFKKIFLQFFFILNEINVSIIIVKFKKMFSDIYFSSIKSNVIIEPALDLNYSNYNIKKTKFVDTNEKFLILFENICLKNLNFENINFKDLESIFISYILEINKFFEKYSKESLGYLEKKIVFKKLKNIYWGQSPSFLIRNLLILLKKKYKIFGVQHGGSYFVTEKDLMHKHSDYFFCDTFLSYGISKLFDKKKYLTKTKLLHTGSFKEPYISEVTKIKNLIKSNIMYLPISLNNFFKPNFQSSQTERFNDQIEICEILNKKNSYRTFVKVLPMSFYKKTLINLYNIETNPIYIYLEKFKNLVVSHNTLRTAVKKIRPGILICDFFSTPIYELANSDIEIILILDKNNMPKKDILKVMKQRFYIIKSPKEINLTLKKIKQKKNKKSNDFHDLYYKSKLNYRIN